MKRLKPYWARTERITNYRQKSSIEEVLGPFSTGHLTDLWIRQIHPLEPQRRRETQREKAVNGSESRRSDKNTSRGVRLNVFVLLR